MKAAPHILPDFNGREVRLIANIPKKLTPYVKELGIRWVGNSECFKQAQQSETCPPSLFCEIANFFHQVSSPLLRHSVMGWKSRKTSVLHSLQHTGCTREVAPRRVQRLPPFSLPNALLPLRAWQIWAGWLTRKGALLGHVELEHLVVERSFWIKKPSTESMLDVTALLLSCLPQHCQEKKLRGHELKIHAYYFAFFGQWAPAAITHQNPMQYTASADLRMQKYLIFPVWAVWSTPQLQPKLWFEHCFLATEEVSSHATNSLTGENEVMKDMGKHKESLFLRFLCWWY